MIIHKPQRRPLQPHFRKHMNIPNIPQIHPDKIRVIPLGGVEEIGKNMTVIEYKDDIVILDAGLQFSDAETPGVDYIVPNTKYLQERKHKIRGLIISHGHLDHVGGIPYLIKDIGNPPIYTTQITKALIQKRQEEFPQGPTLNIEEVKTGQKLKLGKYLSARFFTICHTIPDAIGIIIETPLGNIIYPGDFKIDRDASGKPVNVDEFAEIGKENNLLLVLESTNSEEPGFSISEATARKNLKKICEEAKGRIIIGTFSSLLERIIDIASVAEKIGRKVFIDGYSMKTNIELVQNLGFFKPKKDTILFADKINNYPPEKILAMCTGGQGEEFSALMRIANKKHKYIRIIPGDTIILSSSIVPGNEKNVQTLKDNLARQGAKIIHYGIADVHASGHANQEELKLMIKLLRPKFFMPIHGYYFMLKTNADLAESVGIPKENIAIPMNNGSIIETEKDKIRLLKESAPANLVMVDGLGVGDVQEVVMRDRQALAQDGIFVVIAVIDSQTGKVRNSPDIISRGFVYLRESQNLLKQVRYLIRRTIEDSTAKMHPINIDYVKNLLRENIGKFLFQKTKRRPMVLTVLIEV